MTSPRSALSRAIASTSRALDRARLLGVFVIPCALGVPLAACDGYADLPLPLREQGPLEIEAVSRFTEGPGRVQLVLAPPADALGPFAVVGHPTVLSGGATVLAWALGTCSGPAPDPRLRVCATVRWTRGGASPAPLAMALVLESRGDARRFTLSGEVAP